MKQLAELYPAYRNNRYPEQQALQDLVSSYVSKQEIESNNIPAHEPRICDHSRILGGAFVLPQRKLNSYYTSYALKEETAAWQPGDYIAHAAAGGSRKLGWIRRLISCMKERAPSLEGCQIGGDYQP